jgi:UDP-2,3-diacylglucosamine pyrophosphatase LpxH
VSEGSVAVFADAHLGQAEGDADDFLVSLEVLYARGIRTFVLLGDIFHYFIGDERFATPMVEKVLAGWESLAARGASLRYVEGNRDFFLEGTRFARSFSWYGDSDGLAVGERRWAFVHGDRINTGDLPYRFWRRLSKNPVSRAVLHALPGGIARGIVSRTEARLYRTNFKHKKVLPEPHLVAEGRRARAAGYDAVLIGHFHVEKRFEVPDGVAHVLPAWLEERKHAEILPDGSLVIVEEASADRAVRRDLGPLS